MATSGSFTTTSYEGRSLTFSWNRTSINIANNTSTIAWSVTGSGSYTYGYVTCGDIDIVVNGTTVYNSSQSDRVDIWSGTVVASGTITIPHNADGSKSFSASINAAIYNYAQNCSGSGTWSIDAIPRASGIDRIANSSGSSVATLNTGNDVRVYFTPKTTSFKYRITVSMNGNSAQNNASGVSVTSTSQQYYQVNIPHSWLSNKTSDTLTCKLETLNGSTVIGTSTGVLSMTVPASVVPTINTISCTPVNSNSVINGWGIYVANYSKAKIACTASGSGGSTITSFSIYGENAGVAVNHTSLSYDINLTSSGSKTFTVRAMDSRGRLSEEKSITINVYSYSAPSVQSFDVVRCDSNGNINAEGTSAKLSFVGYYTAIGSNATTANFSYKLVSASTFTALTNSSTGSGGSINGSIILNTITFAVANEYDFKISLKDSLNNTVERTVRLNSVARTLNVAKYGNGVAIGKMSTVATSGDTGKFECGWDATFDKTVGTTGNLTVGGNTTVTGNTSTKNINASGTGSITGDLTVNGVIKANKADGSIVANSIELGNRNNETGRGDGGYIDFHYEGSTLDYTSRIVENNYGVINIMSPNGLLINGASLADFVVQQGPNGGWMIRKWNSGIAECWRKISGTITNSGTWNNFRIFSGSADFPSNFFISNPNVQYCCYIGSGYAINARGALSTTTKFNWAALGTDGDSNIGYTVDCYAIGKWK